MAYGFFCKKCGHSEAAHNVGLVGSRCCPDIEICEKKIHRGYRFSLKTCRGFKYRKKDEAAVFKSYLADPVEGTNLPRRLRRRVEKIESERIEADPRFQNME